MPSGRRPYGPYTGHLIQCCHKRNYAHVVLHNLEVKAADVLNAYAMAPIKEKIWTVLEPKFGDNAGKSAIIVKVYTILRLQVLSLEHILHSACRNWGISPVMLTLTCGRRLSKGQIIS